MTPPSRWVPVGISWLSPYKLSRHVVAVTVTSRNWRIRLVAYGARLESVLGASPRGFESPILRAFPVIPLELRGFR